MDKKQYALHLDELAMQLCKSIDGDFDYKIETLSDDPSFQKLAMLINFLMDTARRSILNLESKNSELEKSQAELTHASKMASIGELAAGVGHEINNPLAIVQGNLRRSKIELSKNDPHIEKIFECFEKQKAAIDRIVDIVDGLRTYSRMSTDYSQALDIHDLIYKTQSLICNMYEKEGIAITLNLLATDFHVRGNPGRFQQVLMILISNAKDALENIKSPSIEVITRNDSSHFYIEVKDNGIGIPKEIQEKIFESFYTTKDVGKGTGIGLGLLSKIADDMSGVISLTSKLGEGSSFSIAFSFMAKNEVEEYNNQKKLSQNTPEVKKVKLKGHALVIDDEDAIRELLIEHLEDLGLIADEASNAIVGLEKVKLKKYDYICTDMKMPNMNGEEFIKQAKMLPNGDTNYFIITGGSVTDYSNDSCTSLRTSTSGYIKKPFTEETIYEALLQATLSTKSEV